MRKLLNRDYLLLLQGNFFSVIGDVLYSLAIGFWVYEKTNSTTLMGIMSSISMFMVMFIMPFSGTIIDKCNRKVVLVGSDLLRGFLMIGVGVLAFYDNLSVPVVLITAIIASFCTMFFSPAVSTLLLDIIPIDDMIRGQSIFGGLQSLVSLVGKATSGALIVIFGVPLIIMMNGISFIISAISEMFIHVPKTKRQDEKISIKKTLEDMVVGIKSIASNQCLRIFIPFSIIVNLLGAGAFGLMLPFILSKNLSVAQYGFIMAVESLAGLIATVILGAIKFSPKQRSLLFSVSFIASTFIAIPAYCSSSFWPLTILLAASTLFNSIGNGIFNAALMLALPEENRGSIIGFVSAASMGACAISSIAYGVLADIIPISYVFIGGVVLSLIPIILVVTNKNATEFILKN